MDSNYEKQAVAARQLFLSFSQEKMIRKFSLEWDEIYLYLPFFCWQCRIERGSGSIELRKNGRMTAEEPDRSLYQPCLDYDVVMTIYDYLCHPGGEMTPSRLTSAGGIAEACRGSAGCGMDALPALSGEWCTLQSLQKTGSSPSPDRLFGDYAKHFSGKAELLRHACASLGGIPVHTARSADISIRFSIFPSFPLIFQFWDGDEEFDPQIMLLWDRSSLAFLNFETLYYVVSIFLKELKKSDQ